MLGFVFTINAVGASSGHKLCLLSLDDLDNFWSDDDPVSLATRCFMQDVLINKFLNVESSKTLSSRSIARQFE